MRRIMTLALLLGAGGGCQVDGDASATATVNAGNDQAVAVGDDVTLTGSASAAALTFAWSQTAGPTVTLSGADTATAAFSPAETGTYVFQLSVADVGTDSVTVNVEGIQNGDFYVDIYDKAEATAGTTLFYDTIASSYRLLEVDMRGETVWEYAIPSEYQQTSTIGLDVEKLASGNYLFFTGIGIYEVDAAGTLVWSYATTKVSHDVQRLPDGDTLYNFGNDDTPSDAQMRRVDQNGTVVWAWYARDHIPVDGVSAQGWTHANAILWNSDDSIFINLRNQYKTLEVSASGDVIWEMDWSIYGTDVDPHEPDILPSGNLLICLQNDAPYAAIEIDRETKAAVWTYPKGTLRTTRDCDRLPNGNTLIVAVDTGGTNDDFSDDYSVMLEVNEAGETVWRMTANTGATGRSPGFFYKAERLTESWTPSATAD